MTAPHATDIVNGYLARLEAESADLPATARRDLIDGAREHIAEVRAEMPQETDVALLNALDRLGDPAVLAGEERERLGLREQPVQRVSWLEIGALILTPLFWPLGVILLWTSGAWNVRDKLIGTFILPGGLFTSLMIFAYVTLGRVQMCSSGPNGTTCSGGLWGISGVVALILFVLIVLSPIFTGIYLGTRLRRREQTRTVSMLA